MFGIMLRVLCVLFFLEYQGYGVLFRVLVCCWSSSNGRHGHVSALREGLVKMCLLVKVSWTLREIMVFWFEFEWKMHAGNCNFIYI